jgi:hypothetical protein
MVVICLKLNLSNCWLKETFQGYRRRSPWRIHSPPVPGWEKAPRRGRHGAQSELPFYPISSKGLTEYTLT